MRGLDGQIPHQRVADSDYLTHQEWLELETADQDAYFKAVRGDKIGGTPMAFQFPDFRPPSWRRTADVDKLDTGVGEPRCGSTSLRYGQTRRDRGGRVCRGLIAWLPASSRRRVAFAPHRVALAAACSTTPCVPSGTTVLPCNPSQLGRADFMPTPSGRCVEEQHGAPIGCRHVRLLYLENHDVFARTVTASVLANHEVIILASVDDALVALLSDHYDAVLVDYDLDGEKGDRFVVHARSRGARLPIIAVSARAEGNTALLAAGATHQCSKLEFAKLPSLLARLELA